MLFLFTKIFDANLREPAQNQSSFQYNIDTY